MTGTAQKAAVMAARHAPLSIGRGTAVGPYEVLALIDDPNEPMSRGSRLTIGRNAAINEFDNIRAGEATIEIDYACVIAQFVSIVAQNRSTEGFTGTIREAAWDWKRMDVSVDSGVWLGTGAAVLRGCERQRGGGHRCRGGSERGRAALVHRLGRAGIGPQETLVASLSWRRG